MAFERYELRGGGGTTGENIARNISVAVIGKKEPKSLSIVLGSEFMKEHGFAIADRVQLYFGTEEDKGKLLIVKADVGIIIANYSKKSGSENGHGLIMRILKQQKPIEDFSGNVLPRSITKYEVDEDSGGIVMHLPNGFFAA